MSLPSLSRAARVVAYGLGALLGVFGAAHEAAAFMAPPGQACTNSIVPFVFSWAENTNSPNNVNAMFCDTGSNTFVSPMNIQASGNIGIETTSPTNLLSLSGAASQTFWMERNPTANAIVNLTAGGRAETARRISGIMQPWPLP